MTLYHPTALIILDGLGINPKLKGNAFSNAHTPVIDQLLEQSPHSTLLTHGASVGLPEGQMGNSEVGHLNIGAGRVVKQKLVEISDTLSRSYLDASPAYETFASTFSEDSSVHVAGLMSDGGVHSSLEHLLKLISLLEQESVSHVYLHLFTDGRDTSPNGGIRYLAQVEDALKNKDKTSIASLCGRYYAMDRDNRSERTALSYDAITKGAFACEKTPAEYIKAAYNEDVTDEFIKAASFNNYHGVSPGDSIIYFNFRADRMRQLVTMLSINDESKVFTRDASLTFTEYDGTFGLPILFPKNEIREHLGEVVSAAGLNQLRAAETEKYPHVTYFFNGGEEAVLHGEDRVMADSPKDVPTYDHKPEMSARELTEMVIEKLGAKEYSLLVLNYANCDMVGHTGVLDAAVKAVETVDSCLGTLLETLKSQGWYALIIADHGNAEQMINYEDNSPHTAHTTYPVPVVMPLGPKGVGLKSGGALCDVAPTIIDLCNLSQPKAMTGVSLLSEDPA